MGEKEGEEAGQQSDRAFTLRQSFTLWSTQSGVTDTGVLVVAKVQEGGSTVSIQIDAFIHHSFYDVYGKNTHDPLKHLDISNHSAQLTWLKYMK